MPTAKAWTGSDNGQNTVKGTIGIMDEQVLGNLSSTTGNYLTARYANNANNWTYYIYFADADGNYPSSPSKTITLKSADDTGDKQHAPAYDGYTNVSSLDGGTGTSNNTAPGVTPSGYWKAYYYTPNQYTINFMDGAYVDGNGNTVTTNGFSGVHPAQPAYIPTANFKTAGASVWTATNADIPEQMRKIEFDFKEANQLDEGMAFEWDIPYNIVNTVLLKNAKFIEEVNRYIRLEAPDKVVVITNGNSNLDTNVITLDQLVAYSRSSISKISPIRVVREQQTVQGITTYTTVKGWKPNTVVLRPLGYAGVVVHASTSDVELMRSGEVNNTVSWSIGKWRNLIYVINKVVPNGMLKSYHTDAIGRYATVLTESPYHLCVDISTADN